MVLLENYDWVEYQSGGILQKRRIKIEKNEDENFPTFCLK